MEDIEIIAAINNTNIIGTSDAENRDCISSNLPPRAMRYTMENKNMLEERGSIYVGLGTKKTLEVNVKTLGDPEARQYQICRTGVLKPPAESGKYFLICEVDDDGELRMGWAKSTDSSINLTSDDIKDITQLD